jgi:hypothetical protein
MPWVLPLRRPNFVFYKLKISFPTRISPKLFFTIIYVSIFYIFSGGVFNQLKDRGARGYREDGTPILLYPDLDQQFVLEGYAAGILILIGAMGIYLLLEATRDPHNTNRAFSYQLIGIVLIVIAVLIIQNMWYDKCLSANICKPKYPWEKPK